MIELLQHGLGLHDVALATVRVGTGLFFALSGWNKLTNKGRHEAITETLRNDHVPFVGFMRWWVPGWELLGGSMLLVGFLTAFAAGVLMIICLVACNAEAKMRVDAYKPINGGDRVADYLYLPEVLYVLLLSVNLLAGTGIYSIDHLIGG